MRSTFTTTFLFLLALSSLLAQPMIDSLTMPDAPLAAFGKAEWRVHLTASYGNPYDYEQIAVQGHFMDPDGAELTVDGFYMQGYTVVNPATGTISLSGANGFYLRFAPPRAGVWNVRVSVTTPTGSDTTDWQSFTVGATTDPGFVQATPTNYLQFTDGSPYVPIGENIAWPNGNPILNYQQWLGGLRANGGNFFRLWQCHWGLGLEWRNNGYQGLLQYQQQKAFYTDWLFDYCAENGIYVMYCLQHHGQVATEVNPNWWESPYNATNGGPCVNTWDFFTNEEARRLTRNRFRYIVARWGYSRAIMAWELFNEVDWTDQFEQRQEAVADWHLEMAAYLKTIDPYQHLVTTSFARYQYGSLVWNSPDIDFTQTHHYFDSPNLERILVDHSQVYLDDYGKPTLNGEFGLLTADTGLDALDPNGIHLHNCMWGTFFGGAMGPSMTWWWDSYVDPQDLYYHFAALADRIAGMDLINGDYQPVRPAVDGPAADLLIDTQEGWAAPTADQVLINAMGEVTLEGGPGLGTFLYGSQWNTQYRNPPAFLLDLNDATEFSVITGADASENPVISISIDGAEVLSQAGVPQTNYTVVVPAGQHLVVVDNTGTDWISISGYRLGGLGQAVDAYCLRDETGATAHGWLLNNAYNHQSAQSGALPDPATGVVVTIPDMIDGVHFVQFYDCLTGSLLEETTATAVDGQLAVLPPAFTWDVAFAVQVDPVAVQEAAAPDFAGARLYPNPATAGQTTLSLQLRKDATVILKLRDATGRRLGSLGQYAVAAGEQQLLLALENHWPA
ncbi:MAG: DUF5060 domain-containing protein, partial [Lewinella sp.]|nr:DUF5060 domain-containing protein [Lewinella sp.]